MRELWADLKESAGAALDRVHPGVLIATGLAAVVIAFGALALALLPDRGSDLADLGLGPPSVSAEDGIAPHGVGGTGSGGGGRPLSDGLTAGDRDTGGAGEAAGVGPTIGSGGGDVSPVTGPAGSAPAPPETRPTTTTSAPTPGSTAPATSSTTARPAPAPTTTQPPADSDPGLIGGLLDMLGLQGGHR